MKKIYITILLAASAILGQAQCLVSISGTNILCNGQCNGAATANPVGVPPYSYLWSPGGMTTQTITGLCAGTYTVTVVDGSSCTSSSSVTITQPAPLTATSTQVNVTCNGMCNGTATAFVTGGTGSYTHKWSTVPVQTTATATALCPGVYYDTIKDANACSITLSPPVTITQPATLTATATAGSVSCFGGSNGSATANPSGGTPAYTYSWNTIPAQTTATISGLSPGNYTCTITDSKGCTTTASCNVNQPSAALAVTTSSSNASCSTCCNGSATSTPTGGTASYTYLWTPSGQTTANLTAACPGNYTVCVTDANGCSQCEPVSVNFTVGINEITIDDLHVYPNPTSGNVDIEISVPAATDIVFTLYNLVGTEISQESVIASGTYTKNLSLQTLPSGVYFLKMGVEGKYITKKIIKL